ncbi:MAG TPA: PEGA domain-containing protein, partial [Candidatus Angelobacter sp.]|nr:PEGA domain-containing protein [Candidatus Angelobacter sp.]
FAVIATILVLGCAMGGYAYHRTQVKMRQLAEQAKAREAQLKAEQQQPIAIAIPAPTPAEKELVASDTTVKFFPTKKGAQANAQKTPAPVKATSSPNQVFIQQSALKLLSQPDGAKVEIDGWSEPNWVTPFTASHLAAGNHTLVFTKAGYLPQTRMVQSTTGNTLDVNAELIPAVSTLVVTSNPQGASVWIDGKDSGMATPAQLTVEKGPHRITVKKAGFKDASTDESFSEGQTLSFSPTLLSVNPQSEDGKSSNLLRRIFGTDTVPEGKGLVHIRTDPEGASIIIDGKTAPKKTNARWPADPGVYSIVLQMDGYKSVHRNIRVQKGKVANIDEILEKQ